MLITITTSNQTLKDILTSTQYNNVVNSVSWQEWFYNVAIQILWAQTIYADIWQAATVAAWLKVTTNDSLSLKVDQLAKINLIASWSNNTDVRVLIA